MEKVNRAIEEIQKEEPFFTELLSRLQIVEDKKIGTAGTDGVSIKYAPKFINSLSFEETKGIIAHELIHTLYLHMYRRGKRQHMAFNAACDYAINPLLVNDFGYKLPQGVLLDRKYYGMSAEEIYDKLPTKEVKVQVWGNHKDWPSNADQKKESIIDKLKGHQKSKAQEQAEAKRQEEKWERTIARIAGKHAGRLPEVLLREIKKYIFIPETDWANILRYFFSEDDKDFTFAVPDRRFLEENFILPGAYSETALRDIVVAFDTSGSINSETLDGFAREFKSIVNEFPTIRGYYAVCDAELHDFGKLEELQGLPRFIGGGGTVFDPVFKKIEKEGIRPRILVFFTDLEAYFPDKVPDYPVFWMVPTPIHVRGSYNDYTEKPPFGRVIRIWDNSFTD